MIPTVSVSQHNFCIFKIVIKSILEFLEVDVTLEETPYSHRTKLAWDTRENSPSGEYLCEAQLKQGGVEEKVWRRKETVLDDDTNAIKKISPNNKWNFFANLFN